MSNNREWLKKIPQHALDYIGDNKIEEIQKEKTDLIKLMFEDDTQGGSLNYPNPRAQTEVNCETTEF